MEAIFFMPLTIEQNMFRELVNIRELLINHLLRLSHSCQVLQRHSAKKENQALQK
ncbi:MAG: hypothetical protein JWP06_557 [Candidatus Saccharibacteria bacterium]|nr:hypothetical protein [Candidatus Saccharibacteria bacterium]